jgi:hypothetical protein
VRIRKSRCKKVKKSAFATQSLNFLIFLRRWETMFILLTNSLIMMSLRRKRRKLWRSSILSLNLSQISCWSFSKITFSILMFGTPNLLRITFQVIEVLLEDLVITTLQAQGTIIILKIMIRSWLILSQRSKGIFT